MINAIRALIILQVEDNQADVALTAHALKISGIPHSVHVVRDGARALTFLLSPDDDMHPRPDLILLDMSLPGMNGYEILREIKGDPRLKSIPVVIFSTMNSNQTQQVAYELQANSYVVKPQELAPFVAAVRAIESYWSNTAALPVSLADPRIRGFS
jgi:CheY-like chemotaxis protein